MSVKSKILVVSAAVILFFTGAWSMKAGEALDVKGDFSKMSGTCPEGWAPNKPNYWDTEGTVVINKVPDTEKTSLQITSVSKLIHIYCSYKKFAVNSGDKVRIKSLMKGKGVAILGLYLYPGGAYQKKEFTVSDKWTEFNVELPMDNKYQTIRIVLGVTATSSVEFMDLQAEIVKKEQAK